MLALIYFIPFIKVPPEIEKLYKEAEMRGRHFTDICMKFMLCLAIFVFTLFPALNGVYNIVRGNLDTSEWFRVFQIVYVANGFIKNMYLLINKIECTLTLQYAFRSPHHTRLLHAVNCSFHYVLLLRYDCHSSRDIFHALPFFNKR